ncbi:MAG: hypothetical protein KAT48_07395, partial [Bacteroidales bacterium]|nr:hypothetical protein [Bacteroidales bacterium]
MKKGYSFKHLLLVILACSIGFSAYPQQTTFNDSWGKAGFTLQETDASHVKINYSIVEFTFSEQEIENEVLQNISLPGYFLPNDEGAPDLPGGGRYIAIPQGATAVLNITSYRTETYTDIDMAPAPRIPLDTDKGPLFYKKNDNIYSKNAFFPEKPFSLSQPTQIRGVDVVMLGITPFQYNPVTKELVVYRDVEVDITFEGGNGYFGDDNYRSRWWDPILNDILLNASMLPVIDYNQRNLNTRDDEGYEYLIVSPNGEAYQRWADSIKVFRTLQGILTGVVTLSEIGGNSASVLEDYFDYAYNYWSIKPVAVLLLGDDGDNMETNIKAPIWQSQCASDNIYADVNNNDMPDMVFARITANNEAQVETMVTKFLNYERNPPINPDFYNHPITALGWQADRWFQICAESIGGFFKNVYDKEPVRINVIYTGNPNVDPWSTATNTDIVVDYFGPDGLGYIPASPSELGGWTGGNASMINNAINSGAFLLQHRDHGGETGWSHPSYQNSDINNLVNTDLSFIFSINCLTGKYNNGSGECFTEKFHRHTKNDLNAGALGVIAASEVSYSFVNDTYVWGMYDNMWPEFMPDYGSTPEPRGQLPAFGNSAGKYFLQQSGWPYNTGSKEVTYNLFHHHGGAFLTLYSEVPQDLTIMHNPILYSETPTFTVTADEGSLIALTVNGEIIGVGEGTGAPVMIDIIPQLPPNQMIVTVTKQNYFRYSSSVDVIPPEGPYVVFDSYTINDINGNNNGEVDFGEEILLSMTTRNVGIEEAVDVLVVISLEDSYITLTDNEELFGNMLPDEYVTKSDAFAFDVSDSVPDGHKINFEVSSTDANDSTWLSYFSITTLAPALEVGRYDVDDIEGNNNGRIDPGETVDIIIEVENSGHSSALGTMGHLATTSQYLTINTSSFELGDLPGDETGYAIFNVTADDGIELGTVVDMIFVVESGFYTAGKTFYSKIGLILEDWETGDFAEFDWQMGGQAPWVITDGNPYEGTYCVKSGEINDQQSSELSLTYDVMADDTISFFYKVSSEANYDYLQFYIDNNMQGQWAGEDGWERAAYPVTAGPHIFTWVYDKDYSVSNGQDCGWIDFISFPPELVTTAYAGPDVSICEDEDCPLSGSATYYESVEWSTSGTGVFDDNTILTPVYTPGEEDINAGEVTLTLMAYGPSREDVSDDMTLTIITAPTAYAGDDALICEGEEFTVTMASAENYSALLWSTTGDGTF